MKKLDYFGENAEFRIGTYAVYCSNIKFGDNVMIGQNPVLMATEH